jgi:hypothetical protein
MGRKSKLTLKQWGEVEKRLLAGEGARAIARDYTVTDAAIRLRFTSTHKTVKDVANQLLSADRALKSLPISSQLLALNLLDELKAVSAHLVSAARLGASTAHRLAGIANEEVGKVVDLEKSVGSLRHVAILTKMSNDASVIGLNLLAANKEVLKNENAAPAADTVADLSDEELDHELAEYGIDVKS